MSSPIPYLGSKICLISKSEIRYEGILYTIDAQESIIALAKVRSFGTEDRPTDMPVPPRDEVFEYIIFRGTDIKKIEVCEAPKNPVSSIHNDPAIVQASSYANNMRQPLGPIGGGAPGSFPVQAGAPFSQTLPQGAPAFAAAAAAAAAAAPSAVGTPAAAPGGPSVVMPGPSSHASLMEMMAGSRSPTPTTQVSRKSPVSDAGVQVSSPPQQGDRHQGRGRGGYDNRVQRDGQGRRGHQMGGYNNHQGNYRNTYSNQFYGGGFQYQNRGGGMRGGMNRGRGGGGRGRGGGLYVSNSRQREDKKIFAKDYDFEQANTQFEELRTKLANAKISTDDVSTENGASEEASKEDTAVSTEGAEGEAGAASEDHEQFYDKQKSFFDNISCESIERSQGRSQRPDWRRERKINQETFGVSAPRRGFYGGRGGGYYGRGGYMRGGYNQGYNQGFNHQGYNHGYNRGGYRGRGGYNNYRGKPRNDNAGEKNLSGTANGATDLPSSASAASGDRQPQAAASVAA